MLATRLCIDAHIIGKQTLATFRELLTFSGALFISMNSGQSTLNASIFENFDTFQQHLVKLPVELSFALPLDIAALPQAILLNLSTLPKLFRQVNAECYFGKEQDLNVQVATNVAVILNKQVKNPHTRCEMVNFI